MDLKTHRRWYAAMMARVEQARQRLEQAIGTEDVMAAGVGGGGSEFMLL